MFGLFSLCNEAYWTFKLEIPPLIDCTNCLNVRGSSRRFYQYLQQLDLIVHFWFLSANWKRCWIKKGLDLFCSRCFHCCQFVTERLELSVSTINKINNRYQTLKLWWYISGSIVCLHEQSNLGSPNKVSLITQAFSRLQVNQLSMQREIGTIFREVFFQPIISQNNIEFIKNKRFCYWHP